MYIFGGGPTPQWVAGIFLVCTFLGLERSSSFTLVFLGLNAGGKYRCPVLEKYSLNKMKSRLEIDPVHAKKSRVTCNITRLSLLGFKNPIQLYGLLPKAASDLCCTLMSGVWLRYKASDGVRYVHSCAWVTLLQLTPGNTAHTCSVQL